MRTERRSYEDSERVRRVARNPRDVVRTAFPEECGASDRVVPVW
jgi:hypothetical protein